MRKSNTGSPSETSLTVLKVVEVKATSNANGAGFDAEAKDFLQDNGFSELRVDQTNPRYMRGCPDVDNLILLELKVPRGTQRGSFSLVRIYRDTRREIERGYTVYVQNFPSQSGKKEVNGVGDDIKDLIVTASKASDEEIRLNNRLREERAPRKLTRLTPPPVAQKPRSETRPISLASSPLLDAVAKDAAPFIQKLRAQTWESREELPSAQNLSPAESGVKPVEAKALDSLGGESKDSPAETAPPIPPSPVVLPEEKPPEDTRPAEILEVVAAVQTEQQPANQETPERKENPPVNTSETKKLVAFVIEKACELRSTTPAKLRSGGKDRADAQTKRIIVDVLKNKLGVDAIELGEPLGVSGRSSVYTMATKATKESKEDPVFRSATQVLVDRARSTFKFLSESAADSGQEKKTSSRQTVVARTSSHAPAEPDSGSAGAVRDASIFALAQLDGLPAECIAESFSIETKDVHEVVGRIALLLRRENREDVTSAIRKAGSLTEKS